MYFYSQTRFWTETFNFLVLLRQIKNKNLILDNFLQTLYSLLTLLDYILKMSILS